MITGRESYEWCVPVGSFAEAHAFCLGRRIALCAGEERRAGGDPAWPRETLLPGEPKRARCQRCIGWLRKYPGLKECS